MRSSMRRLRCGYASHVRPPERDVPSCLEDLARPGTATQLEGSCDASCSGLTALVGRLSLPWLRETRQPCRPMKKAWKADVAFKHATAVSRGGVGGRSLARCQARACWGLGEAGSFGDARPTSRDTDASHHLIMPSLLAEQVEGGAGDDVHSPKSARVPPYTRLYVWALGRVGGGHIMSACCTSL